MYRIYLTDLPEDSQLYKGCKRYYDRTEEVFNAWNDFVKEYFTETHSFLAGDTFKGVCTDVLPKDWRWLKRYENIAVPSAKAKEAYQQFKNLPIRPDSWDLTKWCGARNVEGDGGLVSFITLYVRADGKFIISIPVGRDGEHAEIPEGARQLTYSEYQEERK